MTESMCSYAGDRDGALIALLYDDLEGDAPQRALFEAHVQTCSRCRDELAALRSVRVQLSRWSPPEPGFAIAKMRSVTMSTSIADPQSVDNPHPAVRNPHQQGWRGMPAWAQVAAAVLFLGVSAGVANLDVRYDAHGFTIRTGWSKALSSSPSAALLPAGSLSPSGAVAPASPALAPWRADLAVLEQQLKTEIRSVRASARVLPGSAPARSTPPGDASGAEVVRRVRAMIEESEKRQKSELALRVAEVMRDVHAARQADLVRIDRTLGAVQNNLGVEVMKTRQQVNQMNSLYRASQRQ